WRCEPVLRGDLRLDAEVNGARGDGAKLRPQAPGDGLLHDDPADASYLTAQRDPRTPVDGRIRRGRLQRENADAEPRRAEAARRRDRCAPEGGRELRTARERRDLERLGAARRIALYRCVDNPAHDAERAPEWLRRHRHRPPVMVRGVAVVGIAD